MKEIIGNLFEYVGETDAICITTNGFVKKNGECVMGKGCAKTATRHWPGIAKKLGKKITIQGNIVIFIGTVDSSNTTQKTRVYSFPVKPVSEVFTGSNAVRHMISKFKTGDTVPGWACLANLDLIEKSAKQLAKIADDNNWKNIVLPRPGCGAGELNWQDVKSILDKYLDDRFYSITFK